MQEILLFNSTSRNFEIYLDSLPQISSFAAREEVYGDIEDMVRGGYRGNLHDRQWSRDSRDTGGELHLQFGSGAAVQVETKY